MRTAVLRTANSGESRMATRTGAASFFLKAVHSDFIAAADDSDRPPHYSYDMRFSGVLETVDAQLYSSSGPLTAGAGSGSAALLILNGNSTTGFFFSGNRDIDAALIGSKWTFLN